ncbi:hypothetical protein V5O48_018572, partial [Marasmius crinis-equi]
EINPEDIIYRKQISSEDLELHTERGPSTTMDNCSAPRLRKVKIQKRVHTAEIVQSKFVGRPFTVYTYEPENEEDEETMKMLSNAAHNWTIDVRTGSWHYDLPSIAVRGSIKEDISHNPISYQRIPLPPHTRPELESQQIMSLFEKHFKDFLHPIALTGETRHFDDPTDFAPHGLMTFGTVSSLFNPQARFTDIGGITVFIDDVRFSLIGTFHHDPSTHSPPAYLFVPPIQVEILHGMPCIKYPLPDSFFYWSLDRKGTTRIDEADWEKCGIPELKVETWIGSWWDGWDYGCIEEYLLLKGYPLDGQQYARDRNYQAALIAGEWISNYYSTVSDNEFQAILMRSNLSDPSSQKQEARMKRRAIGKQRSKSPPLELDPESIHPNTHMQYNLVCSICSNSQLVRALTHYPIGLEFAAPPTQYRSQIPDQGKNDRDGNYSDTNSKLSDSDANLLKNCGTSSPEVDDLCVRFANLALG